MPTIEDSKIYSPEFRNISFHSTVTPLSTRVRGANCSVERGGYRPDTLGSGFDAVPFPFRDYADQSRNVGQIERLKFFFEGTDV